MPTTDLMPTLDVIAVGEVLVRLSGEPGRLIDSPVLHKGIGGAESNVLIGLSRLGHRVTMVSKVGRDPLGEEILRTLRGELVGTEQITSVDAPTGLMFKEHLTADRVYVHYLRAHSAARSLNPADLPEAPTRHAHASGITLALGAQPAAAVRKLFTRTREAGGTVSFDPNFRARLNGIEQARALWRDVFPLVTDLLCSSMEAYALTGLADPARAALALLDHDLQRVVVRSGAHGAIGVAAADRELITMPAEQVTVVDTVGAGDGFTTGYLHELLNGNELADCLRTGSWAAASVVSSPGDYQGLPSADELASWQAGRAEVDR